MRGVEAHRSYQEEPEPRWYGGQRYPQPPYPESEWEGQFDQPLGDEGYRSVQPPGSPAADPYADGPFPDPGRTPGGQPAHRGAQSHDGPPDYEGGYGGRFMGGPGSPAEPGGPQAGPGSPAAPGVSGPIGPRSGEPLPPLPPRPAPPRGDLPPVAPPSPRPPHAAATTEHPVVDPPRYYTEPVDRAALRRPAAAGSDGIYRARRPGLAGLIGLVVLVLAVPVLLLLRGSLGDPMSPGGVLGGALALLGLPLAGFGLYGLATGAARIPDAPPTHAWLRPPLAYLAVALVLFVAAGLAVG